MDDRADDVQTGLQWTSIACSFPFWHHLLIALCHFSSLQKTTLGFDIVSIIVLNVGGIL